MSDPRILPKVTDVRNDLARHHTKVYAIRPANKISHVAIHHSLTPMGSAESFARYHVHQNGWPGIGYHFVIEKNGTIKWCHDLSVISYHVGGSNTKSIGICMVGDFRTGELTSAQYASLQKLTKWLMQEFSIGVEQVLGHSEFPGYEWKACPCIDMNTFRSGLSKAGAILNRGDDPSKLPAENGISLSWILKMMQEKGYSVFQKDHEPYNLNLVGVRSKSRTSNSFDDHVTCFYKYQGKWFFRAYKATTDPGLYYLNHPSNTVGTAILMPGQYRGTYQLGLHRNSYLALKQVRPVTVMRDGNRNGDLDFVGGKTQTGIFGINIHRATSSGESTLVNKWSAGCQVLANSSDFNELIDLCKKSCMYWGESFTYTLLEA